MEQPITAEELAAIHRARATRISYNWSSFGRYSVWIAQAPYFGWSIMTDYGKPDQECVVTSPPQSGGLHFRSGRLRA